MAAVVVASVALASCQRNSLRIEGDVRNLPDGPMTLALLDSSFHWQAVDTTEVREGKFVFSGGVNLEQPECVVLNIGNQNMVVFAGNDDVCMKGNALKPEDIEVCGSPLNKTLVKYTQGMPGRDRLAQIMAQMAALGGDVDKREELTEEMHGIEKAQMDYIRHAIADNAATPLGPFLLFNNMGLFSYDEVESFQSAFRKAMPTHKYVRFLDQQLAARRQISEALKRVELGSLAPDFVLLNEQGDSVSLSSLRGSVVLLDFWASWCAPCRKNNKTVVEVYKKFASKGLEVVGVSVDKDRADWLTAKGHDGLPGIQLIDNGGVAQTYGVQRIPASFLIDETGVIVSKDSDNGNIFDDLEKRLTKK